MALWYDEVYEGDIRLGLKTTRTLWTGESEFQKIAIIETERFGKALLLDDAWMTAEGEEKTYHEMIVHPAMATAANPKRVLIIGGGDGGTAREVLRHTGVEHVDMVEIDGVLIEACKEHLPEIGTAWNDPRLNVIVSDGLDYLKTYDGPQYDVILVDGCDPVGPAVVLFEEPFYRDAKRCLAEGGVFVTQSQDPHLSHDVHVQVVKRLRDVFGTAHPYYAGVMLYPGNTWSWTWATAGDLDHLAPNLERAALAEETCEFYNRDIHVGAFAVPNFVRKALR
jgi:spermidine synthase